MIVTISIDIPKHLTSEQKECMEKLAASFESSIRGVEKKSSVIGKKGKK